MVLMPQSGYIHPDEFFQSVEVVTGDVLSTDTIRTWEFNVTSPIRSMALPHLLFGTPLQLLKLSDYILYQITGTAESRNSSGLWAKHLQSSHSTECFLVTCSNREPALI